MFKSNRIGKVIKTSIPIIIFLLAIGPTLHADDVIDTGSVIFIHPDGTGASMWHALRNYYYGPDSISNWDRLERMGMYRSHVLNSTNSSSHGGATIHSYGVKVNFDTYGNVPEKPVKSLSGKGTSILMEARDAGLATALINSGHICEPGTGVFAAGTVDRDSTDVISEQIINSGTDIILSGGEVLLLPKGIAGRHGKEGKRKDGRNLIQQAKENGYTVVYNREELLNLPAGVKKVLGVFAAKHTFNDNSEEYLKEHNLPLYYDDAPTLAEMTSVALKILKQDGRRFLMIVEEEGTDNFGNYNNAMGELTALKRADDAIGVAVDYIKDNPRTLLITAADSEAGGFQLLAIRDSTDFDKPLPDTTDNGAPLDGIEGTGTVPFKAAPDKNGVVLRFGVGWASFEDVAGDVIARAHGLNSHLLKNNVDNTDIYRIMYATLFGKMLPEY